MEPVYFSVEPNEKKKGCGHKQEFPFKNKKDLIYCQRSWTLQEVAQSSCGVSIHGDIKNSPKLDSEQPALTVATLIKGVEQVIFRGPFPP